MAGVKMGLSFNSHPIMVYLQKQAKVDMGHLCYSHHAAKRMTMSISETMNSRLKQHLKEENAPISIILGENCYSKLKNYLFWLAMNLKLGLLYITSELYSTFQKHYLFFKAYMLLRA